MDESKSVESLSYHNTEDELESIKSRLFELEKEKQRLIQRQEVLKTTKNDHKLITNGIKQLSTDEKIVLFQSLFKGRTDIFANRWQNTKGRSGYSVACHNEWISGKCNKPKIKCSECTHRHYKSLDAKVFYDHLSGKQVVGLYPLLEGNLCYLLAVDFDKTGWQEAVKATALACIEFNIAYAIEVSRSGNGAHLWVFFAKAVAAKDARSLGFALLDKAMEIYPSISFESYDRLFPNQDLMPEGGFGNLIALPLQFQARQNGHSLFVDRQLIPYSDQWEFLSQVQKVSTRQLTELITTTANNTLESTHGLPWEQGMAIEQSKVENCPANIVIILANHLYIKLDKLPAPIIARLKRLASFSNPVFFKNSSLTLFNAWNSSIY